LRREPCSKPRSRAFYRQSYAHTLARGFAFDGFAPAPAAIGCPLRPTPGDLTLFQTAERVADKSW